MHHEEARMSLIKVITDSHSSITQQKAKELGISVLPASFVIDGMVYYEGVSLTHSEFLAKLEAGADVSTSQPSLPEVSELWDKELESCDQILYIPISSGLSASCASAMSLSQKEAYAGRVFVVDNGRVATPQYRSVLDALELVEEGYDAPQIKEILEKARADMSIYIAVDTLKYLKKGGRVSTTEALLGTALNIKPVLQFDVGTLSTYKKCRGMKSAKTAMIQAVKNDLQTRFKEQYESGEVALLAASSHNEEQTDIWVKEIEEAFPGMKVLCEPLALSVSCHIGPNGLGIGYSCRPKR
jgi:DegV family protein with EDD domain